MDDCSTLSVQNKLPKAIWAEHGEPSYPLLHDRALIDRHCPSYYTVDAILAKLAAAMERLTEQLKAVHMG